MNDDVIWCEDCLHWFSDVTGEIDCSVRGLHTWYGRSIDYCPYFKRKKKKEEGK